MKIPSIPTDSLYKFIAMSGLFTFMGFIFIPEYMSYEIKIKEILLHGEINESTVDINENTKRIAILEEKVSLMKEYDDKLIIKYQSDLNLSKILNVRNQKILIKIDNKNMLIDFYKNKINNYKLVRIVGSILSFLMMILGFYFWYKRVQKPLDMQFSINKNE